MLILGAVELQIRPHGWWLVDLIPNKCIENADTLAGRIANSPERVCPDGSARAVVGGRQEESRLYSVDGQQIRLNGWWLVYYE